MRESEIEAYFVRRVKEAGGLQRKFVSPGHKGVPDRILVMGGTVYFVEFKAPCKPLRPDQRREHDKFNLVGANISVIDTKELVDDFIEFMTRTDK